MYIYLDLTVFEKTKCRPGDKRKRLRNNDAGDVDGYLGPWGKFVDEQTVMKPNEVSKKCVAIYSYVRSLLYTAAVLLYN